MNIWIEQLDLAEAVVNTDARTVTQRIIVAGMSKNKRLYGEDVLKNAAPLFEGVKAFANHPTKAESKDRPERSVRDVTGWLSNVEYREGALYATRNFTRTQAGLDAWSLVEDITSGRAPAGLMGASINAVGRGKASDDGVMIVESIDAVLSVDDVTTPAAGGGFALQASAGDDMLNAVLQYMTFEEWVQARPDYMKRVQGELKTIRQEEAVKAAKAEADHNRKALQEAQAQLTALTTEREAALAEAQQARRELAIVEALAAVTLPAVWKASLREELLSIPDERWKTVIERELKKATQAGVQPRVAVHGAGAQVNSPMRVRESVQPTPRDDEDVQAWQKRMKG